MKQINLFLLLGIAAFTLTRCDKENNTETPQDNGLKNTTWFYDGGGCEGYYQFLDSAYTMLNPCYDYPETDRIFLGWEKGYYVCTQDSLILHPKESCDNSAIGTTRYAAYILNSDTLLLFEGMFSLKYSSISSMPNFSEDNVEYGYWGADDYWKTSTSCAYEE